MSDLLLYWNVLADLWRSREGLVPACWRSRRQEGKAEPHSAARREEHPWPLSMPLLKWNEHEQFTLADAVCGVQVFGATGSGKSSGPVAELVRAYLRAQFGMLFLTVKPDDTQTFLGLISQTNRLKDVVLMGPGRETTINFIREASVGGAGLVSNLTTLLSVISRHGLADGGGSSGAGAREDGGFWARMESRLLASCADLLLRAGEPVTTINLERLVNALPASREQVGDAAWREHSPLYACLRKAELAAVRDEDREEVHRLASYFLGQIAELSSRTKSTVQSSVGSLLDLFNRAETRRLLSSPEPTFDMSMLHEGKILVVDMPILTHQTLGKLVQMTIKHVFQLAQNRRDTRVSPRPVGLIADEAHMVSAIEQDAAFQTTARSTRTCTIACTQSISNYLGENGGGSGVEARVHALLSNLQTQIYCQSTDTKTVEYAQALFGKELRLLMNGGANQQQEDRLGTALGLSGAGGTSGGFSESMDYLLQAGDFHDLANGGPQHDWMVEALVYQGGKTFQSTGRPYLPARFRQRQDAE